MGPRSSKFIEMTGQQTGYRLLIHGKYTDLILVLIDSIDMVHISDAGDCEFESCQYSKGLYDTKIDMVSLGHSG